MKKQKKHSCKVEKIYICVGGECDFCSDPDDGYCCYVKRGRIPGVELCTNTSVIRQINRTKK